MKPGHLLTFQSAAMPAFIIERELPAAGKRSLKIMKALARQCCEGPEKINPEVVWLKTYITNRTLLCIFLAPDKDTLFEYASYLGFGTKSISKVLQIMEPGETKT